MISPIGLVIAVSCVAVVFAIVYAPSLNFQFILDDHRFTADPRIQFSGHIWDYFTSFVWAQFTGGPPSFYRPIFLLWMRINYILCDLSTWGWHLLSMIKHAAVALLLAWLVWKLLRDRTAALLGRSTVRVASRANRIRRMDHGARPTDGAGGCRIAASVPQIRGSRAARR